MEIMNNALKLTAASENKRVFYKSPSVKVIQMTGETIICTSSGTEGYGMNSQSLSDDDFE